MTRTTIFIIEKVV